MQFFMLRSIRGKCQAHACVWTSLLTSYPVGEVEVFECEALHGVSGPAGGRASQRGARLRAAEFAVIASLSAFPVSGERRAKHNDPRVTMLCTARLVVGPLVLSYYGCWDVGTVAAEQNSRLSSAKRVGVYPGAIRTNGEKVRPPPRNAYIT